MHSDACTSSSRCSVALMPRFEALVSSRLEEAADLIRCSWAENADQALDFDAAFLRSAYEYPGTDATVSPALIEDGRLVAFVSAFPRQAILNGVHVRLALLTFFTVAPAAKGSGIGKATWAECLTRVREAGFDGALHYCVAGNRSNAVTVSAARSLGLNASQVFAVEYLIRAGVNTRAAGCNSGDIEPLFNQLVSGIPPLPLVRTWTTEEISWQCSRRSGAWVLPICTPRGAKALITGYRARIANPAATPVLIIEDILWGDLSDQEKDAAVAELIRTADVQLISVPLWGYADMEPFIRARFRRSPRRMNVYLTMWSGASRGNFTGMYMDVF